MRRSLALFSIASVLPLVVLGGTLGALSLRAQQAAIEDQAGDHARFVGTLLSRELIANMRSAQMIAQSPAFDAGFDEVRFTKLALRLVADEPLWRAISVSAPDGTRVLDVPEPIAGVQGGPVIDLASQQAAIRARRPVVGRIVTGARGRPAFAVRAPVTRKGEVVYVVSCVVEPSVLRRLLLAGSLPDGWRAEVLDGAGAVVATSEDVAAAGESARPAALAARKAQVGSFYRDVSDPRAPRMATSRAVPGTGWTVHVSMPANAYAAPLRQAAGVLVAGLAVSLFLIAILARLLVRELQSSRQRQAAVSDTQRLEALGRMTGGVAHDINNLLTPIIGGLDLLQRRFTEDPRAMRAIDGALVSAERAKTLVSRLLAFARRQTLEPQDVDVAALMEGLVDLLSSSISPGVELSLEIEPQLPSARVDPAQLELAILNLAVNANDAMPQGGRLMVSAADRLAPETRQDGLSAGRYVLITVEDTGAGMAPAVLQRAVEPFFTTKPQGKGTGLGLSMVHGLAAQSGGALRLYSEPGAGVRAEIWLPASQAPATRTPEAESLTDGATGQVLLVDDDDLVRRSTAEVLRDHGHVVVEARSASEALQALRSGARVDVMVTDYAMPGRSGAELIAEARTLRPGLPVLLITGFANAPENVPADVPRLAKPFRRVVLLNRVSALMALREPGEVLGRPF